MSNPVEAFKIKNDSNVHSTATALSKYLLENGADKVEVQAVGAGAVNQAYKILVETRAKLSREGKDLLTKCGMRSVEGKKEGDEGKTISIAVISFYIR